MTRLFGTSGVRGIIGEDFTPESALNLSRSLTTILNNTGLTVIGKDPRTSSDLIENIFTSGLLSGGVSVQKLGVVPTPTVGFATRHLEANAGIMITASHNPPEYNGIKFFDSEGIPYDTVMQSGIEEIHSIGDYTSVKWSEVKRASSTPILNKYIENIHENIELNTKFKVVLDCANGAASQVTPYLLNKLRCDVTTINSHLNGFFPGRPPEPVSENLNELCEIVKLTNSDIGLAHDGDGDRIVAVDETGRVVPGDKLLALVSSYYSRKFGCKIVTTVDASKVVDDQVIKAGGEIIRTRVGDVSVAREMKLHGSNFGGEPSGTWICGDVHMCPDGILSGIRVLEMIEDSGEKLSKLINDIPDYPVLRTKVSCREEEKQVIMKKVKEEASKFFNDIIERMECDGLRLKLEDESWILIRPSGTEPYIRITVESNDMDEARGLIKRGRELIKDIKHKN